MDDPPVTEEPAPQTEAPVDTQAQVAYDSQAPPFEDPPMGRRSAKAGAGGPADRVRVATAPLVRRVSPVAWPVAVAAVVVGVWWWRHRRRG